MKKTICALLVLLLIMTAAVACGDSDNDESSSPVSAASQAQSQAESDESTASGTAEPSEPDVSSLENEATDLVIQNFNRDFTVLSIGGADYISEIIENEIEADSESWMTIGVNDAIAERNRKIFEKLGVTVKERAVDSGRVGGEMLNYIRTEINGSNYTFDVCAPSLYDCGTLAAEGNFVNLLEIESLNMNHSWWDQSFNESMTVNNCLFFTLGDIGLTNKNATPVVYFNKQLAGSYGVDSTALYQLVRDQKWTFDKAYEYSRLLSVNLDDVERIDYNDKVGWAGQADDTWNFFFASGEKIVSTNAKGELELTMYNPRSVNVSEKMYSMFRDAQHYISANDYFADGYSEPTRQCTGAAFMEGRVMFFSDNLSFMHFFAAMDDPFGVLPTPKFDDAQETYNSLINPWTGNAFAIPTTLDEEDAYFAGAVLDMMGYLSVETVAFEYEQRTLKYQKTRDDESIEMLQLILDTRGCDFGIIYNIGSSSGTSLPSMLQNIMKSPAGTFTSSYNTIVDAAQSDLDGILDAYSQTND